jgi:hypothetical protein
VFEALVYRVTLTGPGEIPEQSIRHGELLELTVPLGMWQLEVRAYKDGGLAGTAHYSTRVDPGLTVVDVPMKLNHGYFSIGFAPRINGSVEADTQAAFPGATINLKVLPEEGYKLKTGSLTVNNGTIPLEGSGPEYSFVMPSEDVTISAEFNQLLGIEIEVPGDETIVVAAEHSVTGPVPEGDPLEISWTDDETLTFTLDSEDYNAEDGTLRWLLEGADLTPGTGTSLVIKAKDHVARTYTLTVMIRRDDQWYSQDISFTVVE